MRRLSSPHLQSRTALRVGRTGLAVAGGLALVVASLATGGPSARPHPQRPGDIGNIYLDQVVKDEAVLAAQPKPDPTGVRGAGPRFVAYHPGGRAIGSGGVPRFFRTGAMTMEPTMGIDHHGALYVGAQQRQTVAAFFYTAQTLMRSTDGGGHWVERDPSTVGQASHPYSEDPYLYVDPATSRVFRNDLILPCQETSYSDDGGLTWTTAASNCDQADHQTIFAGRAPRGGAQPSGYPDVVYDCAINAGADAGYGKVTSCDKSLDGGRTFQPTGGFPYVAPATSLSSPLACDGATGHGFVGRDGTVYLPRGWCGQPYLAISHDEGATWTRVQVARNGMNAGTDGSPDYQQIYDHEASVATDRNGTLYYLWIAHDYKPYLAISRDGRTWSRPMMVAPPGVRETALPSLDVSPSQQPGHVAIAFVGSTNAPTNPYPHTDDRYARAWWNGYLVETTTALANNPVFYGGAINDPRDPLVEGPCAPVRCGAEYDFIDVAVSPAGQPYAVFVDACAGPKSCAAQGEAVVGTIRGGPGL